MAPPEAPERVTLYLCPTHGWIDAGNVTRQGDVVTCDLLQSDEDPCGESVAPSDFVPLSDVLSLLRAEQPLDDPVLYPADSLSDAAEFLEDRLGEPRSSNEKARAALSEAREAGLLGPDDTH